MATEATKIYSNKQEKMVAKELKGYPVGGSGAAPCSPGDVKTYDWLVECKTHTQPGHSILFDTKVWKKVANEALAMHRKPVLIVDDGSQKAANTWCLCRAANINLVNTITVEWPAPIRTNLTCKHDKLTEALKSTAKRYIGEFYETSAYEVNWEGETVLVLPLKTFKELFEK